VLTIQAVIRNAINRRPVNGVSNDTLSIDY